MAGSLSPEAKARVKTYNAARARALAHYKSSDVHGSYPCFSLYWYDTARQWLPEDFALKLHTKDAFVRRERSEQR